MSSCLCSTEKPRKNILYTKRVDPTAHAARKLPHKATKTAYSQKINEMLLRRMKVNNGKRELLYRGGARVENMPLESEAPWAHMGWLEVLLCHSSRVAKRGNSNWGKGEDRYL